MQRVYSQDKGCHIEGLARARPLTRHHAGSTFPDEECYRLPTRDRETTTHLIGTQARKRAIQVNLSSVSTEVWYLSPSHAILLLNMSISCYEVSRGSSSNLQHTKPKNEAPEVANVAG